jgi:hypothetical protein
VEATPEVALPVELLAREPLRAVQGLRLLERVREAVLPAPDLEPGWGPEGELAPEQHERRREGEP